MLNLQTIFGDKFTEKSWHKTLPAEISSEMNQAGFGPDQFYFDIRLCEIYLRKQTENGARYVPRALSITKCLYEQRFVILPVAVGEEILAEIGAMAGSDDDARAVTFSNCRLVGPVPYRGGDIEFFGGLYRVEAGNVVDSAINLVADITGKLGLNLTNYIEIGRQVAARLPSVLGVDSGNWRLGHYAPIYKPGDVFFDRYLILIGDDGEPFDPDALEIHELNGQESLQIRHAGKARPFDARDYLLIKLHSAPVRNDYERFEFHKRFEVVKKHLLDHNLAQAEWARNDLNQQISTCTDLIGNHQLDLILMYEMRVGKWKEKLGLAGAYVERDHKGGGDDTGDDLRSGAIASTALNARLSDATVDTLENVRKSWNEFENLLDLGAEDEYSTESVNSFLRKMSEKRVEGCSASELVEAIRIRSLTRD